MSATDWAAFRDAARDFYARLNADQARLMQAREDMEGLEMLTHRLSPVDATRQLEAITAQYRGEQ